MKLMFELTNEQRKYLGLILVQEHWELVKFDNNVYYYFEDDIIKKEITVSKNYYHEAELNEKTAENRTVILPKTARGKIKIRGCYKLMIKIINLQQPRFRKN